jgi:uncharacterized protein (TIGR02001 family)
MTYLVKKLTIAAALSLAFATMGSVTAYAEDAPAAAAPAPEATPDNVIAYNIGLVSDYRYRGISQSRLDPALQGGVDWTNNPTGFYAGTWLSTIKWIKDAGGNDNFEWDIYGGKRGEIAKDITYDVGGLYYLYQSNDLHPSANTFEVYGQISAGPFSLKYSDSTTNLFGFPNSKNSGYVDAQYNQDVYDGYTLNLHVGHQEVHADPAASYSDWKVGVTKDYGVASVSLAYLKASTSAYLSPEGKNLGKGSLQLSVLKTF